MGNRREPRVEARLEVRIAGIDAEGRPLLQLATTRNISRQGALVEDIQGTFKAGEIISVSYKGNKARFRLAWVGATGTDKAGQIGLESVDPAKCIWDAAALPSSAADTYASPGKERRRHQRVPCRLGAELYLNGASAPVRVHMTDVSVGGCFVPMPTLPPESGGLKMVVWINGTKLTLEGVIANRRPGFGISIRFTGMSHEASEQIEHLIQAHLVAL
jgi:hypothetical protein